MRESRGPLALVLLFAAFSAVGCDDTSSIPDTCTNLFMDGRESDVDCGGPYCPVCTVGDGCYEASDCATGNCNCGQCREPGEIEGDGVQNGPETDVDCGGGCQGCDAGQTCVESTDCDQHLGLVCLAGTCVAPGCSDGVQNGDETAVDCGGSCDPCALDEGCAASQDCCSGLCDAGRCVATSCSDNAQNGHETDLDCGGEDAAAPWLGCGAVACDCCAADKLCRVDSDCCDGVCHEDEDGAFRCASPNCLDEVRNGNETDEDCGGPDCDCCDTGRGCAAGGDCCSGVCNPVSGTCQAPTCTDRVYNGRETDVDCGGPDCGCCAADKDCGDWTDCCSGYCSAAGKCVPASCGDRERNGDETDVDCGGSCDPCADLLRCDVPEDCTSGVCEGGVCQAPACDDGVHNGNETGVDCGGPRCECCDAAQRCVAATDCCEGVCDLVFTNTCLEPACDDGVHNGDETDVDCGGPTGCPRCANTRHCSVWEDCASGYCAGGICVAPTCVDGVHNGGETDVDCGGATTCPRCDPGDTCLAHSDCLSSGYCGPAGLCVRGVTCLDLLVQRGGSYPDGPYDLDLDPDGAEIGVAPSRVYCDMTTDGGGWTLVASSRGTTLNDDSGFRHSGLETIFPTVANEEVWIGMLPQLDAANHSDIRFSCRTDPGIADFEVDLAFYDNDWYYAIARSVDSGTCWSPATSPWPLSSAPDRRNLVAYPSPLLTSDWGTTFTGEWSCDDLNSFTVDLNGPGMTEYGDRRATSWGEVYVFNPLPAPGRWEVEPRCGTVPLVAGAASWFIWVRELP